MNNTGTLIISLDFELYWGMRDKVSLREYGENVLGVRRAIPGMLEMFRKYGIHATWATVGFLFYKSRDELLANFPPHTPKYHNARLSPYDYINNIKNNEKDDPYHFAPSLIELIKKYDNQEIGSHTFSHYYALEKGQTAETFREDIRAAKKAARNNFNIEIKSLVFPRNQFNDKYMSVAREEGVRAIRGNEDSWLYSVKEDKNENIVRRGLRLLDAYINLSGYNTHAPQSDDKPLNLPASRFLRPYSRALGLLEPYRFSRIKNAMTYAAKNNETFHLWWHPHNFGVNQKENFINLETILKHFKYLSDKYGMESMNMGEVADRELNTQ